MTIIALKTKICENDKKLLHTLNKFYLEFVSYLNYILENSLYCRRKRTKAIVNGFGSCDEIE